MYSTTLLLILLARSSPELECMSQATNPTHHREVVYRVATMAAKQINADTVVPHLLGEAASAAGTLPVAIRVS